jgi:hypothetical protein
VPHPAEGDEQLGVGGDDRPGGLSGDGGVVAHPDDVGDDDLGCRRRVGAPHVGVAAEEAHEAVHLGPGQVEPSGGPPPVGPPEHRPVAVLVANPRQLRRHEIECLVPPDFDVGVLSAQMRGRTGATVEPRPTHGRPGDPQLLPIEVRGSER